MNKPNTQPVKGAATQLRAPDGAVKATIVRDVTFNVPATFLLKLQRDTEDKGGNARLKAGAAKAYQSFILNLGDGIQMRGQVYVPASLLTPEARANAEYNAKRAAELENDAEKPAKVKRAAESLGA